jgi:geranylgeranyl diphosphate synthase type II
MMVGVAFMVLQHSYKYEVNVLGQLYQTLSSALIEVCEGQELDMKFNNSADVNMQDYFTMIEQKTSALFRCSSKLGAISANAPE